MEQILLVVSNPKISQLLLSIKVDTWIITVFIKI